jgi:hypothetical protein
MENNRWEGNQTNIRFITFEIQNRIEESLPLSRVMMPKVPISSFQWRRNCVQRRILGCREKSRGYFTWTKQTKFYDVLTHSRKQKHTLTHSHTHTVEMCVVVVFFKNVVQFGLHSRTALRQLWKTFCFGCFSINLHTVVQSPAGWYTAVVKCCWLKTGELFYLLQQLIHRVLTGKVSPEKVKISGEELNPTCMERALCSRRNYSLGLSPTEQEKCVRPLSARDYHSAKTAMRHLSEKRRFEGRNKWQSHLAAGITCI